MTGGAAYISGILTAGFFLALHWWTSNHSRIHDGLVFQARAIPALIATWLADAVEHVLCYAARRALAAFRFWQGGRFEYRMSLRETAGDISVRDYAAEDEAIREKV